jgi:hypothetical protein
MGCEVLVLSSHYADRGAVMPLALFTELFFFGYYCLVIATHLIS